MIIDIQHSPNEGPRPRGANVSLIVLHGTEGTDAGDLAWLLDPSSKVSYHYLIQRTGHVTRLVEEDRRAWHAGAGRWRRWHDVNDISIGTGLSNRTPEPYTDAQYVALGELLAMLLERHDLSIRDVVGHYHVSPGRKVDPGFLFEWGRAFAEMQEHM